MPNHRCETCVAESGELKEGRQRGRGGEDMEVMVMGAATDFN